MASTALLHAAAVQFVIDPSQSKISLSGSILGSAFTEQAPGSLDTTLSGTLTAMDSTDGIQFTGGKIVAADNGIWKPVVNGGGASFGAHAEPVVGPVDCAMRNIIFSASSLLLPYGNDAFDSSGVLFSFAYDSTASFDLSNKLVGVVSSPIDATSRNNLLNGGSLRLINGNLHLALGIDVPLTVSGIIEGDTILHLVGLIVGDGVPVPAITSYQLLGDSMTIRAEGIGSSGNLQVSTDCKNWSVQPATRADDPQGSTFSFSTTGDVRFFRIAP